MTPNGGSDRNEPEETSSTDVAASGVPLSLDAILDLLADHQRREILQCLVESADQTATMGEIADRLISVESERTGKRPGRDQVEVRIHHTHLPKLTEAGVVEYDARTQELRYWQNTRLEDILEFVTSAEVEADNHP